MSQSMTVAPLFADSVTVTSLIWIAPVPAVTMIFGFASKSVGFLIFPDPVIMISFSPSFSQR